MYLNFTLINKYLKCNIAAAASKSPIFQNKECIRAALKKRKGFCLLFIVRDADKSSSHLWSDSSQMWGGKVHAQHFPGWMAAGQKMQWCSWTWWWAANPTSLIRSYLALQQFHGCLKQVGHVAPNVCCRLLSLKCFHKAVQKERNQRWRECGGIVPPTSELLKQRSIYE